MRNRNPALDVIAERGIVFDQAIDFLPRHRLKDEYGELDMPKVRLAMDEMAMDAPTYAQPALSTSPNSGVPTMLTTYLDPKLIEVLFSPLEAENIYGVTKKGDWTTDTAMFGMVEMTGFVASYNDFSESGRSDANVNWPQRQAYQFQTFTEWGERELERMAAAKVDWAARKNISSANSINRFMNLMYFYGIAGLQNYGGLNDPSLAPALTPTTKAAGGTSWANALPTEILADVQKCYAQLQGPTAGTGGNIDRKTKMTLGLSPVSDTYIANTNSFGLTAAEMIQKAFPGITIKTAVQYQSGSTYNLQLIVDEIEGQRTAECAFTEKMRAHRILPAASSFRQKKSAGGMGTVIYRPIGIAAMTGI